MKLPWRKDTILVEPEDPVEARAADYGQDRVNAALTWASGPSGAVIGATGALEAAAGLIGRSFAAAEVAGPTPMLSALTPAMLQTVGRSLIRRGEIIFVIQVVDGELMLLPAVNCNLTGGPNPSTWRYDVTVAGPSTTLTYSSLSEQEVLHFKYSVEASRPWAGVGPIQAAALAGRLSANTISMLADEAGGPVGSFLPMPISNELQANALKGDIKTAQGGMLAVESGDLGNMGQSPQKEWTQNRFGASPPAALVQQLVEARHEVWHAVGIHAALFDAGDSAAIREAWRFALFGLLSPMGRLVAAELQAKLDGTINLDWTDLRASDLAGRARAFGSLVNGGMDIEKAAALSGLVVGE